MEAQIVKEILEIQKPETSSRTSSEKPSIKPKKKKDFVRMCIYDKNIECSAPSSFSELCKTCPYGYSHCFGKIMKNIYKKTVGLAISMMQRESSSSRFLGGQNTKSK